MEQERNESEYKKIPLLTRILIQATIFLVKRLNDRLLRLSMACYFSISIIDPEDLLEYEEEQRELH